MQETDERRLVGIGLVARTAEPPRPEWRGLFREPDWPPEEEDG